MPPGRLPLKPYAGKEIPISILEMMSREEMLWISGVALPIENFRPVSGILFKKLRGKRQPQDGRHPCGFPGPSWLGRD